MFNNCVMAMYLLSLAIFPSRDYYLLMYDDNCRFSHHRTRYVTEEKNVQSQDLQQRGRG